MVPVVDLATMGGPRNTAFFLQFTIGENWKWNHTEVVKDVSLAVDLEFFSRKKRSVSYYAYKAPSEFPRRQDRGFGL